MWALTAPRGSSILERVVGIEPTLSAWKAEVLPLNYTREYILVEGEGFEPSKAEPSDLQSDPFDRSGTPPKRTLFSSMTGEKSMVSVQRYHFLILFSILSNIL